MPFCSNCGAQIAEGHPFCTNCGAKVELSKKGKKTKLSKVIIVAALVILLAGVIVLAGLFAVYQNRHDQQVAALQEEYDQQVAALEKQHAQQVAALMDGYAKLRSAINSKSPYGSERQIYVTPNDIAVANQVQVITGGFSEDVNEQWKDYKLMYDWIVSNISYSRDSPIPILPYSPSQGTLIWKDEYWRMPNETLEGKTGDCEDMAVLLASMLISYDSGKYPHWVIGWTSENSGHMAVAFPVTGGNLAILDPAGKYYTGKPYSLTQKDISTAVNDWLAQWPEESGIHVSCVFSDSFYKAFSTTSEFVQWAITS